MSAVKPTAEDYEKAIAEVARDPYNSALYTGVEAISRIRTIAKCLASHRQPESDMEAQRVLDLAEEVERNDDWTAGNVVRTLRAYAKLLRGERE